MAEDLRINYLDALKREKECRDRFVAMERMISDVASALSTHPFEFAFNNIHAEISYRSDTKRVIDGRVWPQAEQIQEALSAWYLTREEAIKCWKILSPQNRQGITPPLGYKD